ncbi:antibiotic biosynthesis monooxygenase [Streptomyces rimosus]|uniref:antibiotic biosynthesis monooxygenase n=1 Tax=Streptomyces rimosus TaxID=1927 RepID=UPI0004C020DC|nr:antibiotic biosynthesis monooxygenase [Streptomyces rimosus]
MTSPSAYPDVRRPDAGTVLVSPWIVPSPDLQRRAADSVLDAWEGQPRPDAMLSLSTFLSDDGSHVLNYAQWTDDDAHREWVRHRRPATVSRIDESIPGIRRPGVTRYTRYRSYAPEGTAGRPPGLLVTPTFATTGPAVQHALADLVIDALERERVPGLLGAHLHLSKDGGRVLNFAEWADTAAWREFAGGGAAARLRAAISAVEGVTADTAAPTAPGRAGVTHYRLHRSLVNVPAP